MKLSFSNKFICPHQIFLNSWEIIWFELETQCCKEFFGLAYSQISLFVLIDDAPETKTWKFLTEQISSFELLSAWRYMILVNVKHLWEWELSILVIAHVALMRMNQLGQISRVNGDFKAEYFREFTMEVNDVLTFDSQSFTFL